jgi:hypothetical protein
MRVTETDLFELQAARTPCRGRLWLGVDDLSSLTSVASRLAQHLRTRGVGPEVLVGVFAAPSIDLIVAILGVLKAAGPTCPSMSTSLLVLAEALAKIRRKQSDWIRFRDPEPRPSSPLREVRSAAGRTHGEPEEAFGNVPARVLLLQLCGDQRAGHLRSPHALPQDVIEGALLDRLAEVTKREHLNELAARVNAAVARLATEIPAQEAELQKRIAAARTEAGRLVEFIAAGHVPALVREKFAELERQIEGAEAQLATIGESGLQSAPTLHPQVYELTSQTCAGC